MKAEHRKELHTNALAAQLNRLIEGVKSRPDNRSLILIIFVVAVVGVGLTLYFFHKRSQSRNSEELRKLADATNLSAVEQIAKEGSGRLAGRLAQYQEARVQLKEGLDKLASSRDRKSALEKIRSAGELYERLAEQNKDIPILAQEALLNAAKARESLGEVDAALSLYDKLAKAHPKSEAGKMATARIENLKAEGGQVKEFYQRLDEDLAKAKPSFIP